MAKRQIPHTNQDGQDAQLRAKRQRIEEKLSQAATTENVTSARQLQQLLAFRQDSTSSMSDGLRSFKTFLETIVYPKDTTNVPAQRSILKTFLDSRIANGDEPEEKVLLPDLMQIWSFASQTNGDRLFTAVVSVLALLLRTLSMDLASREQGTLLGKTVLQYKQLKLLQRGLSAQKHKDYLISPCLRLLTEVVSFDGGALASQLYIKRDFTFENRLMVRCLGLKKHAGDMAEERLKPSVRTNTIRYILMNFRVQREGPRIDILKQGNLTRALFEHVADDPLELVEDILAVLKKHVIEDKTIPRPSKSQILTEHNLGCVTSLYRRGSTMSEHSDRKSIDVQAHEFLTLVCTTPNYGLLLPSSGWYPRDPNQTSRHDNPDENRDRVGLGFDSLDPVHKYNKHIPIRNVVMASFAQSLRPYSNMFEQELLLSMFEAAPELVADYFHKKEFFSFDPKLTSTWIGYSALLFSAIQLPIPNSFGAKPENATKPPPLSIVLENILPRPLNQKVLTRCLNSNTDLIHFFAVRILIVAFQKLSQVISTFSEGFRRDSQSWQHASEQLKSMLARQFPPMKDVITAFRRPNKGNATQREAVARLLSLYYTELPSVALSEKFDVSVLLINLLAEIDHEGSAGSEKEFRIMELSHLVRIAQLSPDMKWWSKPESLPLTPFTTLLRLVVSSPQGQYTELAGLVGAIVIENDFFQTLTEKPALDALISSLSKMTNQLQPLPQTLFQFLDNCLTRLVRRPIKYLDDVEDLRGSSLESAKNPISPLVAVLAEQWPFAANDSNELHVTAVAGWIARLFVGLREIGEDKEVLDAISTKMDEVSPAQSIRSIVQELTRVGETVIDSTTPTTVLNGDSIPIVKSSGNVSQSKPTQEFDADTPPAEDERHPELTRWIQKDLEEAVSESYVADLLRSFSSQHVSIRIQALTNARKLLQRLEQSNFEERTQVHLLIAELIETTQNTIYQEPLPYVASVFAGQAVTVLSDPSHFLYPKINKFLNKGPAWNVERLPSYWAGRILLDEPNEDEGFHREIHWLLDLLYDSLRSHQDIEIFRVRNIFERVLALYTLPTSRKATREKILRLISRAIAVGGSTTLVTRAAMLDWLKVQLGREDGNEARLRNLLVRLKDGYDVERIAEWSGGKMST